MNVVVSNIKHSIKNCLALSLLALSALASNAEAVTVVEFYNASLDHYFVTANTDEVLKLDNGIFKGWARTGHEFGAVSPTAATSPGLMPVCRFYGNPALGLDSHFYSAAPEECAQVRQKFPDAWVFESENVFQVYVPDRVTGMCPSGTSPLFRSWNNRSDSNHRYTTDPAVQASMVAKGYVAEGYGEPPVVMCVPPSTATTGTATLCREGDGFFDSSCTSVPVPFVSNGSVQATLLGASTYTIERYQLTAVGGPITVSGISATDANRIVSPSVVGLLEGQRLAQGQTVHFTLSTPLTRGRQANLRFQFSVNGASAFDVRYLVTTN
jgi:hypothetical protein